MDRSPPHKGLPCNSARNTTRRGQERRIRQKPSWARFLQHLVLAWTLCVPVAAVATTCCGGGGGGGGGTYTTTYYEQGKLIRAGEDIQALGPDLMGDSVNEYSGTLSFTQTDFNLPGNNALAVAVGRHMVTGTQLPAGLFGDWDLEIPHLHTLSYVLPNGQGDWTGLAADGVTYTEARCSQFQEPGPFNGGGSTVFSWIWWDGYHMSVPGAGDQTLLSRYPYTGFVPGTPPYPVDTEQPSDGNSYPVLTKDHWQLSCLSSLDSGTGEGFMAHAPDGTQYRFDHMVSRPYPELQSPSDNGIFRMGRAEVWILPTQVTDRFGNWVRYSYDTSDRWKLLSISASDGRTVTFTYVSGTHLIQTVSDGTRTWTYAYGSTGTLQSVTQPDSSTWQFSLQTLERNFFYNRDPTCFPGELSSVDANTYTGTIVHPSGATGTFSLKDTWHGRSNVNGSQAGCFAGGVNYVPTYFATYSLMSKTLSGPGLPAMTWSYQYGPPVGSWAPCNGCVSTTAVTITDPQNNVTQNVYGTQFAINEGLLLSSSDGWNGSSALRTTSYSYAASNAGPYPSSVGYHSAVSEYAAELYTPQTQRTITQQGASFTQSVTGFDSFARPSGYTRSSSLGYSKSESLTYYDNTSLWVLGQVATRTIAGVQASSTSFYPATALPSATYTFGKLQTSYAFNADGTLSSITDGLNQATTYSSYMRGLAQHISYADSSSESAVVNNIGLITSVTNEAGTTWGYGYDAIGRLASVIPPGGDPVSYAPKTLSFVQVPTAEYGLDPNHWRQTITVGNAVTINYFDARWRKRLALTYDAANAAATQRMQRFDYDPYNRTTFASYPAASIGSITTSVPGSTSAYDVLGRLTQTAADSELGTLTTRTQYLAGFQTQVTNPRNLITTTSYQVFDDPDSAALVSVVAPESLSVSISRDVFGKPLSIIRSGSYGGASLSATRSYVYDANQLLCKTVEPEIGATIQTFDAANNLAWRATGLSLTSVSTCDVGKVPSANMVSFTYDTRNRLKQTSFGDGSASIGRTYTADGLPFTVGSNGSTWTYSYNHRRLLTQESLSYGSVYNIGWGYDANGHISQLTYPDSTTVSYSPDALGEPTQVSGYASGVTYWPNGAVAGYTLANGIAHSQTQNVRGLPSVNSDAGILQDVYSYDPNGNIVAIVDQQQGVSSRKMSYDGLDRLTVAVAPSLWCNATYGYDPLGNIRTSVVGNRSSTLSYDGNNRLSAVNTDGVNTLYAYDNQGNVAGWGTRTYHFDEGNRLTQAPGIASYTYDGLGRRTSITEATGITRIQIYDAAGQLLYGVQQQRGTTQATRYVYMGKLAIAETDSVGGTTFLHTDALGSPVATSNASGSLLTLTRYEPYGATAAGTNPDGLGFTGHVNDPSTGLVYMQQRYYDPIAARFLSVDPIVTDTSTGASFNRYEYVNSNPYRYFDPNGTCTGSHIADADGACASTGGFTTDTQGTSQGGQIAAARSAQDGRLSRLLFAGVHSVFGWVDCAIEQCSGPQLAWRFAQAPLAVLGGPEAGAARGAEHVVLGLRDYGTRELADRLGATHLLDHPEWMSALQSAIRDSATKITVNLEGFSGEGVYSQVMGAVQRGVTPAAKYTEWEMARLYEAGRLGTVNFVNKMGEVLANPF